MGRPKVRDAETRERVLTAALQILEADGPSAIRARAVAGAADTSTGALYEFFGDKAGLVRAIFYEGFAMLDERQRSVAVTDDPRADLVALMAATRSFALDHPRLFDVMFARPFEEFDPAAEDEGVGRALYRRTVDAVGRLLAAHGSNVSSRALAEILVVTHRGLVAAELAGTFGRSRASRDRKYQLGVEVILAGLLTASGEEFE